MIEAIAGVGSELIDWRVQMSLPERLPYEPMEFARANRRAFALGAGVVVAALAVGAIKHFSAGTGSSHITAQQLALERKDTECHTIGAWDVSHTEAHVPLTIEGLGNYFGRGSIVEKGKVIDRTCLDPKGVKIVNRTVNGQQHTVVQAKRSAFVRQVTFSLPDTQILPAEAPGTKIKTGVIDILTGLAEGTCQTFADQGSKSVKFGGYTIQCAAFDHFYNANNAKQDVLDRTLQVDILDTVRVEGGIASFPETEKLFRDAYRDRAKEGGIPNAEQTVDFELVDDDGQPTTQPPDFKQKDEDQLIKEGILRNTVEGAPDLHFTSKMVIPLPNSKQ